MVVIDKLFNLGARKTPMRSLCDVLVRVGIFVLNAYIFLLAVPSPDGSRVGLITTVTGQFQKGSPLYQQAIMKEKKNLHEQISTNPDVNLYFNPENAYIDNNGYIYDYPNPEQYRISMLIDPCRFQEDPACCMNVFGSPEYPLMKIQPWEQDRIFKPNYFGSDTEVQINFNLVDELGFPIDPTMRRYADDEQRYDERCVSMQNPYSFCAGKNYAYMRSPQRPDCIDNNYTLNTLAGCRWPNGTRQSKCFQVAYSQDAFIPMCKDESNTHCGTFLEIHMANGSPYQDENDVIADVRITNRSSSGFSTTVLPSTFMGNSSRVLCTYTESYLRLGTNVYVEYNPNLLNTVPVCCCPKPFKPLTRVGSFFCPLGPIGNGPFAYRYKVLQDIVGVEVYHNKYPFCPNTLDDTRDLVMCSIYDEHNKRHYVRNCTAVTNVNKLQFESKQALRRYWTSFDLDGKEYHDVCPYYYNCALTLDEGKCNPKDYRHTFIGRVGRITALDNTVIPPLVWLTFNDGRTSYQFLQEQVKLEVVKSMYEIWWVVRTPSEFVVQMKKGFNVSSPICTFDLTNNRFFPYAIVDKYDMPLDSSLV